jgi:hypothetical protein
MRFEHYSGAEPVSSMERTITLSDVPRLTNRFREMLVAIAHDRHREAIWARGQLSEAGIDVRVHVRGRSSSCPRS